MGGTVVNPPVSGATKQRRNECGVWWGSFPIYSGDAYFVPSGVPHEFLNRRTCLSIAWNCSPRCDDHARAFRDLSYALSRLRSMPWSEARIKMLMDHCPFALLERNILLARARAADT